MKPKHLRVHVYQQMLRLSVKVLRLSVKVFVTGGEGIQDRFAFFFAFLKFHFGRPGHDNDQLKFRFGRPGHDNEQLKFHFGRPDATCGVHEPSWSADARASALHEGANEGACESTLPVLWAKSCR